VDLSGDNEPVRLTIYPNVKNGRLLERAEEAARGEPPADNGNFEAPIAVTREK
jgi:hypothetical protein